MKKIISIISVNCAISNSILKRACGFFVSAKDGYITLRQINNLIIKLLFVVDFQQMWNIFILNYKHSATQEGA